MSVGIPSQKRFNCSPRIGAEIVLALATRCVPRAAQPPAMRGEGKDHRRRALRARPRGPNRAGLLDQPDGADLLETTEEIPPVDQTHPETLGLVDRGGCEARGCDEHTSAPVQTLSQQRASELADLLNANAPCLPLLALHQPLLAAASQPKIDAPVWPPLLRGLGDIPARSAEQLTDEQLELVTGHAAQIGRELELLVTNTGFKDRDQPRESNHRGEHRASGVHGDQNRGAGPEEERQTDPPPRVRRHRDQQDNRRMHGSESPDQPIIDRRCRSSGKLNSVRSQHTERIGSRPQAL